MLVCSLVNGTPLLPSGPLLGLQGVKGHKYKSDWIGHRPLLPSLSFYPSMYSSPPSQMSNQSSAGQKDDQFSVSMLCVLHTVGAAKA